MHSLHDRPWPCRGRSQPGPIQCHRRLPLIARAAPTARASSSPQPPASSPTASLQKDSLVSGVVVAVRATSAVVQLNDGVIGLLRARNLSLDIPQAPMSSILARGDGVTALVNGLTAEGMCELSTALLERTPGDMLRDPAAVFAAAEETLQQRAQLEQSLRPGIVCQGHIVFVQNSFALVDIGGTKNALLHVSEASEGFDGSLADLFEVGEKVTAVVTKRSGGNNLGPQLSTKRLEASAGDLLRDKQAVYARAEAAAADWLKREERQARTHVGDVCVGTVQSVQPNSALVDIGVLNPVQVFSQKAASQLTLGQRVRVRVEKLKDSKGSQRFVVCLVQQKRAAGAVTSGSDAPGAGGGDGTLLDMKNASAVDIQALVGTICKGLVTNVTKLSAEVGVKCRNGSKVLVKVLGQEVSLLPVDDVSRVFEIGEVVWLVATARVGRRSARGATHLLECRPGEMLRDKHTVFQRAEAAAAAQPVWKGSDLQVMHDSARSQASEDDGAPVDADGEAPGSASDGSLSEADAKLAIQHLPATVTEQELEQMLLAHGPLVSCGLFMDAQGRSTGAGFAHFKQRASAVAAQAALHGRVVRGGKAYISLASSVAQLGQAAVTLAALAQGRLGAEAGPRMEPAHALAEDLRAQLVGGQLQRDNQRLQEEVVAVTGRAERLQEELDALKQEIRLYDSPDEDVSAVARPMQPAQAQALEAPRPSSEGDPQRQEGSQACEQLRAQDVDPSDALQARAFVEQLERYWQGFRDSRARPAFCGMLSNLSTGLYTSATSSLNELIQNAEDAHRRTPQEQVCALSIELGPGYILLSSNEQGFSAEDVDALCNASQSGKSVSSGDIGEKGLGFKSVFSYCHNPHIASKAFSFCFRPGVDPIDSYITPRWVEQEQRPARLQQAMAAAPGETHIYLPLLDSVGEQLVADMWDGLVNGQKTAFMLNMRQLQTLVIINVQAGRGLRISRTAEGDGPVPLPIPTHVPHVIPEMRDVSDALASTVRLSLSEFAVASEQQASEQQASEQQASEQRASEQRASEQQASEQRASEQRQQLSELPQLQQQRPTEPPQSAEAASATDSSTSTPTAAGDSNEDFLQEFLVYQCRVRIPSPIRQLQPTRAAASHASMLLALPCSKASAASDTLPVCAFLPVEDVGLRFLLNADWVLVPSREAVQENAYNRHLRDAAAAFLAAVGASDPRAARLLLGRCLPTPGPRMSPWWARFVDASNQGLRKAVPSLRNAVLPDPAILALLADCSSCYTPEQQLAACCGVTVRADLDPAVSTALGLRPVTARHLLSCFPSLDNDGDVEQGDPRRGAETARQHLFAAARLLPGTWWSQLFSVLSQAALADPGLAADAVRRPLWLLQPKLRLSDEGMGEAIALVSRAVAYTHRPGTSARGFLRVSSMVVLPSTFQASVLGGASRPHVPPVLAVDGEAVSPLPWWRPELLDAVVTRSAAEAAFVRDVMRWPSLTEELAVQLVLAHHAQMLASVPPAKRAAALPSPSAGPAVHAEERLQQKLWLDLLFLRFTPPAVLSRALASLPLPQPVVLPRLLVAPLPGPQVSPLSGSAFETCLRWVSNADGGTGEEATDGGNGGGAARLLTPPARLPPGPDNSWGLDESWSAAELNAQLEWEAWLLSMGCGLWAPGPDGTSASASASPPSGFPARQRVLSDGRPVLASLSLLTPSGALAAEAVLRAAPPPLLQALKAQRWPNRRSDVPAHAAQVAALLDLKLQADPVPPAQLLPLGRGNLSPVPSAPASVSELRPWPGPAPQPPTFPPNAPRWTVGPPAHPAGVVGRDTVQARTEPVADAAAGMAVHPASGPDGAAPFYAALLPSDIPQPPRSIPVGGAVLPPDANSAADQSGSSSNTSRASFGEAFVAGGPISVASGTGRAEGGPRPGLLLGLVVDERRLRQQQEVADAAEALVAAYLEQHFKAAFQWVSAADDSAGFDFTVNDARGLLLGDGRPRKVMLEVKGFAGAYADVGEIHVSANQVAKRDQVRDSLNEAYVLLGVEGLKTDSPRIAWKFGWSHESDDAVRFIPTQFLITFSG